MERRVSDHHLSIAVLAALGCVIVMFPRGGGTPHCSESRRPGPPAPQLPDHPAYQQIMAVFVAADAPPRARQVCEAMDLKIAPNNINDTRLKLKRLTERGILVVTEQGLFTQPRP